MSIETLMTLGLAAVIFLIGLLLLGILTTVTRLTLFVLRPAARGGYSLTRRYAPVAAARLAAFWERTSPAITAVGHRLGAEAVASIEPAAALAASWGRRFAAVAAAVGKRLAAEAAAWARSSAAGTASVSKRSAAGAVALGKRSTASAATLSERSAESLSSYVTPAVRAWFTDDEDLGLDSTPSPSPRRRARHS